MNITEGITASDKTCPECGSRLRLHSHVFAEATGPVQKTYYDCTHCGYVTDWEPVQIERIS